MFDASGRGRIIGALLLIQLAGFIVPFVLLLPVAGSDYLNEAAHSARNIKFAIALLYLNTALTVAISILAFPIIRQHTPSVAVLLVALGAIMFTLQAVDNAQIMSMLALSEESVRAGNQGDYFKTLSSVVRAQRRWVHYGELMAIDAWLFTFFATLFRFRILPRAVAGFASLSVVVHFASITLPLMFGLGGFAPLGAVMGLGELLAGAWLVVKGVEEINT